MGETKKCLCGEGKEPRENEVGDERAQGRSGAGIGSLGK